MKKLIVVGLVAFLLGLFVATLLKTSYAQLEEMLSHIQLLVVKIGSTIAVIMVITGLLTREFQHLFQHLFPKNDRKQPSDEHQRTDTQPLFD
jgi:flagellar motor component MotA